MLSSACLAESMFPHKQSFKNTLSPGYCGCCVTVVLTLFHQEWFEFHQILSSGGNLAREIQVLRAEPRSWLRARAKGRDLVSCSCPSLASLSRMFCAARHHLSRILDLVSVSCILMDLELNNDKKASSARPVLNVNP